MANHFHHNFALTDAQIASQFEVARQFLLSNESLVSSISPIQSFKLEALFNQSTVGPNIGYLSPHADLNAKQQWKEWKELGSMSKTDAQRAFVAMLIEICRSFEPLPNILSFFHEIELLSSKRSNVTPIPIASVQPSMQPSSSSSSRPRSNDLKNTVSQLSDATCALTAQCREEIRQIRMAEQAQEQISSRKLEITSMKKNMEELSNHVSTLIKQLDSDLSAALARRRWCYDQIESTIEELEARSETCLNTYKNQSNLVSSNPSTSFTIFTMLVPIGAGLAYWWYRKKRK